MLISQSIQEEAANAFSSIENPNRVGGEEKVSREMTMSREQL